MKRNVKVITFLDYGSLKTLISNLDIVFDSYLLNYFKIYYTFLNI